MPSWLFTLALIIGRTYLYYSIAIDNISGKKKEKNKNQEQQGVGVQFQVLPSGSIGQDEFVSFRFYILWTSKKWWGIDRWQGRKKIRRTPGSIICGALVTPGRAGRTDHSGCFLLLRFPRGWRFPPVSALRLSASQDRAKRCVSVSAQMGGQT